MLHTADYHMDCYAYMDAANETWLEHTEESGMCYEVDYNQMWEVWRDKYFAREFPLMEDAEWECDAKDFDQAYCEPVLPDDGLSLTYWEYSLVGWCGERGPWPSENHGWWRLYGEVRVEMSVAMLYNL